MSNKKLKIALLVHKNNVANADTINDHINSFILYSKNEVVVFNLENWTYAYFNEISKADVVVLHYTASLFFDSCLPNIFKHYLKSSKQLKAIFIQDEYKFVDHIIENLNLLEIDLLFTCVPVQEQHKVYPLSKLPHIKEIINVLTGYVPENLMPLFYTRPDYDERYFDVIYRARKLSSWYGRLGREKWMIVDCFQKDAAKYNLKVNLSYHESDRIYGKNWINFLQQAKAVLGVESGAGIFDFTGKIQKNVEEYEKNHPNISFEEIESKFFPNLDNKIYLNQISPRCFESAVLGTLMILYEGNYSGILKPWQHYIPLKKDHSNINEVITALRDKKTWEDITSKAYKEIAINTNYSYKYMIKLFDDVIDKYYKETNNGRMVINNKSKINFFLLIIKKIIKFLFNVAGSANNFLLLIKKFISLINNYRLVLFITYDELFKIIILLFKFKKNIDIILKCMLIDIAVFKLLGNSIYNVRCTNRSFIITCNQQEKNNFSLIQQIWNLRKKLQITDIIIVDNPDTPLLPEWISNTKLSIFNKI